MTPFEQQDAKACVGLVEAINAAVRDYCRANPVTSEKSVRRAMSLAAGEAGTTWALSQTPADARAHVGAA